MVDNIVDYSIIHVHFVSSIQYKYDTYTKVWYHI